MSEQTVETAVRLVAASGHPSPRLALTGGEPFLEPDLVRLAASALRRSTRAGNAPTLAVFTNGTALVSGAAEQLAADDVEVTVSFDGVAAAQSFRDAKSFPRLEEELGRIAADRPERFRARLGVRITLHSGNVRTVAESVSFLASLGLRRIEVAPLVTPDPGWDDACTAELERQLAALAAAPDGTADEGSPGPFRPFGAPAPRSNGSGPMCGLGAPSALFLDVDGSVAPCGAMVPSFLDDPPPFVRKAVETLSGVRVSDSDLAARMSERSKRVASLSFARVLRDKRSRSSRCATCEALIECYVCPASIAYAPEQDPDLVPAIQCDWNRLAAKYRRAHLARVAGARTTAQRAGKSSIAAETSAVTPARIDGA